MSNIMYVEMMSNNDLVTLYNEKLAFINESCKAVRMARKELTLIIDEVDERAEQESIPVTEFYKKYGGGMKIINIYHKLSGYF